MKECKEESFVFYASFYDALLDFPEDVQFAVLKETARYGIYGGEPRLTGISAALFKLIRPQLDANRKRRAVGRNGGAPKGNQNAKKKTEGNEEKTTDGCIKKTTNGRIKKQPNENVNENENVNDNENENVNENVNENENVKITALTSVNNTHALRTSEQSKNFDVWLTDKCPYIAKHYTLPTDTELQKLVDQFGAQMVADVCEQIENRADLRKKYTNLYRTLLNWLKRETDKNMNHDERERNKRLASYAAVTAEFLNTEIRDEGELSAAIPF